MAGLTVHTNMKLLCRALMIAINIFFSDDILQAVYSSDVKCEYDKTKTAKSIIQFKCNKNNITVSMSASLMHKCI
jgi:tRNA threonylcarbamoyladenosine modification (KEOPS) complex  Pcc1 subunit